jgi:hypothetical protein
MMNRRSVFIHLGMICGYILLATSIALAGFNYKDAPKERPTYENATVALKNTMDHGVTQLGSGIPEKKQSFGDKIILARALEIITPKGWHTKAGRAKHKKISWETEEGDTWIDDLEKIGRRHDLRFVVDWDRKSVMVPASTDSQNDGSKSQKTAKKEERSWEVSEKDWRLEEGSLKEQLSEWAEKAGYKVIWNAQHDFRISASANFHGTFTEAVKNTIKALYQNGARIEADIYKANKVIYISSDKGEG